MRGAEVWIAGVGMHPFGRHPGKRLRELSTTAVRAALDDAGLTPANIQVAYFANSMAGLLTGQESIRGQATLHDAGIRDIPILNVENACASSSTGLWLAVRAVASGEFDNALVVGAEKMFVADRATTLAALRTAADIEVTAGQGLQFAGIYAMRLQPYLDAGVITSDHLATVTVKNQRNASLNPYAQFGKKPLTTDDVLSARKVAGPLTLPMVAGISDGAAAVVVTSSRPAVGGTGVAVRASALRSGSVDGLTPGVVRRTVEAAYQQAGIGPRDLGVVEVHDAAAPAELLHYETLGLCDGDAIGQFLDSGATGLGGRVPVNTSGGLSARGHPVGATGLAQICELTWQLRGTAGPRQVAPPALGLAQNSGGWLDGDSSVCAVHVLEARR